MKTKNHLPDVALIVLSFVALCAIVLWYGHKNSDIASKIGSLNSKIQALQRDGHAKDAKINELKADLAACHRD